MIVTAASCRKPAGFAVSVPCRDNNGRAASQSALHQGIANQRTQDNKIYLALTAPPEVIGPGGLPFSSLHSIRPSVALPNMTLAATDRDVNL